MKKLFFFVLMLMIQNNISTLYAQIIGSNKLPGTQPSNPTSSQFLKYGEVPVSNYTGTLNISVPIYTINAKGLNLPIGLSYHSSGIRVNEESGWVGLGWTLKTGGHIVQIVNNYDDFGPYKNRVFPDIDEVADAVSNGSAPSGVLNDCNGTFIEIDDANLNLPTNSFEGRCGPYSGGSSSSAIPPEIMDRNRQLRPKDFEPDIFRFSALGYSGTFVLNWNTEQFSCLTDSRIRVRKHNNSDNEIVITTPEGHHVIFSALEVTNIHYSDDPIYSNFYSNNKKVTSRTYKVKEIYTNQNEHIEFFYTTTPYIRNFLSRTVSQTSYETTGGTGSLTAGGLNGGYSESKIETEQSFSFLNKITFNNGIILFNSSSRIDIDGTKKLDEILVKTSETATQNIKKVDFSYDYFVGHNNGGNYNGDGSYISSNERTHRLKLNSVHENGKNPYLFEYNNTQLPQKTSYAQDYWGFYNGNLTNNSLFPDVRRFNYDSSSIFNFSSSNNRSSRLEYTKAAILEKIVYPTKGYSTFEYELNSFANFIVPNFTDNQSTIYSAGRESYGNGLRIKKTINFDNNGTKISQKNFSYADGKLSIPVRFFNKSYINQYEYKTILANGQYFSFSAFGYRVSMSSSNYIPSSIDGSGNNVGYGQVTEEVISNQNESINNGKIEYVYENHINQGIVNIGNGVSLITNLHWSSNGKYAELGLPTYEQNGKVENGSLLEQKIYNSNNDLVQKTKSNYNTFRVGECFNGVKIGSILSKRQCGLVGTFAGINNNYTRTYMLGVYPIRNVNTYLIDKETIFYYDGDKEVSSKEELSYDYFYQLTKKKMTNSDNKIIEELFTHNNNFSTNVISPIKTHKILKNGKLVSDIENTYYFKNATNGFHPTHSTGKIHIQTTHKDKISDITTSYSNYDNKGNVVDVTQTNNGLKVKYIWDFNKENLLLKIEGGGNINPSGSLLSIAVNLSQNGDSQALRDALDAIRNSLPNAKVTSYTYLPLVGLKSITDYRGHSTFYEYDAYNRLLYVKDYQGNILSKNEYNYKN